MNSDSQPAEVTVIIVSYNTRDLTLRAIETLLANAGSVAMKVIIWDNASADGSADAIAARFPELELVRSEENLGFGKPHNILAKSIDTEWMLLLNSDTETHQDAVENLLAFAQKHPDRGIYGGRTVFADGSLNPTSCWNRMTPWSIFCQAVGLSMMFKKSRLFNPEGIGGWQRDSVREVDLVTGCFFLLHTELWHELGGFKPNYFMYGEETDLCMRASKLGYRHMITPDAQIMHLGGASATHRDTRVVQVMRSKASLIRDHWERSMVPIGIGLLWLWIAIRRLASLVPGYDKGKAEIWRSVWRQRKDWLAGY